MFVLLKRYTSLFQMDELYLDFETFIKAAYVFAVFHLRFWAKKEIRTYLRVSNFLSSFFPFFFKVHNYTMIFFTSLVKPRVLNDLITIWLWFY